MSATASAAMRIGDVARLAGTTTRTIRYYEEIGLLAGGPDRASGKHRLYTDADVKRLREVIRLKELLGVSLDELKALLEVEDARATLRREWHEQDPPPERRREILNEALGHIAQQLNLVRRRRAELDSLSGELEARQRTLRRRLKKLADEPSG
jgi:DNA-binding transcriptional MerR regulator